MSQPERRPETALQPTDTDHRCHKKSILRWGDEHGVLAEILPFKYRTMNPLDYVRTAQEMLEQKPPTAREVRLGTYRKHLIQTDYNMKAEYIRPAFAMFGSWQLDRTGSQGRPVYANPSYVHFDSMAESHFATTVNERRAALQEAAGYGVLDLADVAPRFGGMAPDAIQEFVDEHDIPWAEWRAAGRERMAKTWVTLLDWGYDADLLCTVFGVPESQFHTWVSRAVPSEWTPPEDPSTPAPDPEDVSRTQRQTTH